MKKPQVTFSFYKNFEMFHSEYSISKDVWKEASQTTFLTASTLHKVKTTKKIVLETKLEGKIKGSSSCQEND